MNTAHKTCLMFGTGLCFKSSRKENMKLTFITIEHPNDKRLPAKLLPGLDAFVSAL